MPACAIAAVVLAAGEGRRMGGPKALLPIGEHDFLDHVCRLYLARRSRPSLGVASGPRPTACAARRVAGRCRRRRERGAGADGMLSLGLPWPRRGRGARRRSRAAAPRRPPARRSRRLSSPSAPRCARAPRSRSRASTDAAATRAASRRPSSPSCGRLHRTGERARCSAADPGRITYVTGGPGSVQGIDTPEDYRLRIG